MAASSAPFKSVASLLYELAKLYKEGQSYVAMHSELTDAWRDETEKALKKFNIRRAIEFKGRIGSSSPDDIEFALNLVSETIDELERYTPPLSANELLSFYQDGKRFFPGSKLSGANLSAAVLPEVDLSESDLSDVNAQYANLSGSEFSEANLSHALLNSANLSAARLMNANLRGAILPGAHLIKAELTGADCRDAEFRSTNLESSTLNDANFTGAILNDATMRSVTAIKTVFDNAQMISARMQKSTLGSVSFVRATLNRCDLHEARLSGANFTDAVLPESNLANAVSTEANFRGADLSRASFYEATMRIMEVSPQTKLEGTSFERAEIGSIGGQLLCNANNIRDTRLPPRMKDTWSILRRGYTGTRLLFHLLFLLAFVAPLIGKAVFWVGVNRAQVLMVETVERERTKLIDAIERVRSLVGQDQNEVNARAESALMDIEETLESLSRKVTPCLSAECRQWRVLQLLLGLDRPWQFSLLTILLLLYNVSRFILTYHVGPLREEEERSGFTPALVDYRWLGHLHRIVSVLWVGAIISILYHAWHWLLGTVVQLPAQI